MNERRPLICLDARYHVESGASTYIKNVMPGLLGASGRYRFLVMTHGQLALAPAADVELRTMPITPPGRQILWTQLRLPGILRRAGVDLYHSLKHLPPWPWRGPSIYSSGSVGYFTGDYPSSFNEHLYWKHVARRIFRRTDRVIAVSEHNRKVFIETVGLRPEQVPVINHGIEERFRPLDRGESVAYLRQRFGLERPFLLCVGNVFPVKNHRAAVDAFAQLRNGAAGDHDLVLVGHDDHPYAVELRRHVEADGLADRVRFLGYVERTELPRFYSVAGCLVQPSLHEGFPLAPLEAMACGLPVVCSRRGGLPDVCGEAALYLEDPHDVAGLAGLLAGVAGDPGRREELSRRARVRAARFTWQEAANRTLALYGELLG